MKQETIKRGEFLRELGLSSGALMAFYCMGTTLTACSSGSNDPTPTPTTPTSGITGNADASRGAVNFTLDLNNNAFATLKNEGGFVVVGSVIVANTRGRAYVALSRACTHQGTTVEFRLAQNDFFCNNHGSRFGTNGAVLTGPATTGLRVYRVQLSTDGNNLTVTE
ncbi:MAG: ubiquinol-cytochrome c reductase iron-sulfur subunit [Runella sp.]